MGQDDAPYRALRRVLNGAGAGLDPEGVVRALLDFGSETPDNLDMAERINVSRGLSLRESGVPLSELFALAVDSAVPVGLDEDFPEVGQLEWSVVLATASVVCRALEPSLESRWEILRASLWGAEEEDGEGMSSIAESIIPMIAALGEDVFPDAANAASALDVAEVDEFDNRSVGLSLRGSNARLSDILWMADGSDVPERLARRLPDLSREDWSAALRAAKLLLLASESAAESSRGGA